MMQEESLTITRMLACRSLHGGFDLRERALQQFAGLAERDEFLGQCPIAEALKTARGLLSPLLAGVFQSLGLFASPASRERLEGIGEGRFGNDIQMSQSHQKRRGTHAVHPLELNQLGIPKPPAMFTHLSFEMGRRHEKRPGKVVGGLLKINGRLLINQAMRKLMREREPSPLQRMRLVDHNYRYYVDVFERLHLCLSRVRARKNIGRWLHHAGHPRYALWQRRDAHFNAMLFEQLGQIGNGVLTEVPRFADLDGELLCIFHPREPYFGNRPVPFCAVQVENFLDSEIPFNMLNDSGFHSRAIFCRSPRFLAKLDTIEFVNPCAHQIIERDIKRFSKGQQDA